MMRSSIRIVLKVLGIVLAVILVRVPATVWAQAKSPGSWGNLQIDVQVRDPDGTSAASGASVTLDEATGGSVGTCQTGQDGKCRFLPRFTSVYVVTVRALGYQEVTQQVDLRATSRAYVDITLKPRPGSPVPAGPKDATGASVSAADLAVPDNARKEFDAGQKALEAKDFNSGIAHLQKAIKLYDAFPQAYIMLGGAYVEQQKYKEAEAALQKAIQLDPKAPGAYIELGATFNQMKNYPEAEKALNQGLELNPDAVAGHYELAKTYMALGRWQDAEPHAVKALAGLPDVPPVHVLMGNILLKKRDAEGALREFQEYLRLDPNGPMAAAVRDVVAKIQKALVTQ